MPLSTRTIDLLRHLAGRPGHDEVKSDFRDLLVVARRYALPAGKAPGATAADIPWLRLEVTAHRGNGMLTAVTTVQRINTSGGAMSGPCDRAGALHSAPYAADYVFLGKTITQ